MIRRTIAIAIAASGAARAEASLLRCTTDAGDRIEVFAQDGKAVIKHDNGGWSPAMVRTRGGFGVLTQPNDAGVLTLTVSPSGGRAWVPIRLNNGRSTRYTATARSSERRRRNEGHRDRRGRHALSRAMPTMGVRPMKSRAMSPLPPRRHRILTRWGHSWGIDSTIGAPMSTISLTYDELAERLGITGASARNLVRRRKWKRVPGNDGKARIAVPEDEIEGATRGGTDGPSDRGIDAPSPFQEMVARLELEVAGLREIVMAERGRAEAEARRADGEARRADGAEADRDAWRGMAQRPWWRRLAG